MDEQLQIPSEYEERRRTRIAENRSFLVKSMLDIGELPFVCAPKGKKVRKRKLSSEVGVVPRRSNRVATVRHEEDEGSKNVDKCIL